MQEISVFIDLSNSLSFCNLYLLYETSYVHVDGVRLRLWTAATIRHSERHGRVNTLALYSGGPGLKSRPGYRLFSLSF
jgi:hypothetical protein